MPMARPVRWKTGSGDAVERLRVQAQALCLGDLAAGYAALNGDRLGDQGLGLRCAHQRLDTAAVAPGRPSPCPPDIEADVEHLLVLNGVSDDTSTLRLVTRTREPRPVRWHR